MIILHAVLESTWEEYADKEYYGEQFIQKNGFIHCSSIDTILLVANSNFTNWDKTLLLCIDTVKTEAKIKWEDLENCGILFPHIYGLLNKNTIIDILEFHKDSNNKFIFPKQLYKYIV